MNEAELFKAQRLKRKKLIRKKRRNRFLLAVVVLGLGIAFAYPHLTNRLVKETNAGGGSVSNDVVYPPMPEPTSDLLAAVNKPDGIKTCYLTFDDGPTNSVTPKVLDTLRRYNIKATFFTVGNLLEANADMARRIFEEGHLLANHSYSHNYSNLYADKDAFMNEIDTTFRNIINITGQANYPHIFRFPGGGFNSGYYGAVKQEYKNILKENKIRYCDWNALNGDAEGKAASKQDLVARVKKTTNKEDVVILMHDAPAKMTTAESLPEVIEYLIEQGFIFKRLDQAPLV